MKIKDGFVLREVCGETVIIGVGLDAVNFGKLLVLNETAAWLWKEARKMGCFTLDALVDRLCEEYDVAEDIARADVSDILGKWQKINVVE